MLVIDYAWWRPDPALVKHAGYDAVIRYISHDSTKNLLTGEIAQLHAANLGIGVVFEDGAQRALSGAAGGTADATFANAYLDAIGYPKWKPIGFAVDFDVTAAQLPVVLAYVEAASRVSRDVYGYGSAALVDALTAAGLPNDWQTVAWSHNVVDTKAALYQRLKPTTGLKGSFDEDVVLHPSNDLWFPADVAPISQVVPQPQTQPSVIGVYEDMRPFLFQDSTGIYSVYAFGTVHVPDMDDVNALGGPAAVTKVTDAYGAAIRAKG